jgi:hypothetical protein
MKKDPNTYPPGWDYEKAARVAEFYDRQRDEDVVAEIEAAIEDEDTVMVQVPRDLLPQILKLIGKRRKSA